MGVCSEQVSGSVEMGSLGWVPGRMRGANQGKGGGEGGSGSCQTPAPAMTMISGAVLSSLDISGP